MSQMRFTVLGRTGETVLDLEYERVFAIGYAGRDMEKTMEHIRELEERCWEYRPRKKFPPFFSAAITFLTQERELALWGTRLAAR